MSEQRPEYRVLQTLNNSCTLDPEPPEETRDDWAQLERLLIPILNYVRKKQDKKPVIVPKG